MVSGMVPKKSNHVGFNRYQILSVCCSHCIGRLIQKWWYINLIMQMGGVHKLLGGNISNTNYNEIAGYLDKQCEFQRMDLVNGRVVHLLMYTTKGVELILCVGGREGNWQPSPCKKI